MHPHSHNAMRVIVEIVPSAFTLSVGRGGTPTPKLLARARAEVPRKFCENSMGMYPCPRANSVGISWIHIHLLRKFC